MRRILIALTILTAGQAVAAGKDGYMCHSRLMPEMIVFKSKPCAPGLEARETSPAIVTMKVLAVEPAAKIQADREYHLSEADRYERERIELRARVDDTIRRIKGRAELP